MTAKPENPPAFASTGLFNPNTGDYLYGQEGMSLRDWFAGRAMQAIVAGLSSRPDFKELLLDPVGRDAYRIADTMLLERENRDAE